MVLSKMKNITGIARKVSRLGKKASGIGLDVLDRSGLLTKKEAKLLLKEIIKEAKAESHRVGFFAQKEASRELNKARPLFKKGKLRSKKLASKMISKAKNYASNVVKRGRKKIIDIAVKRLKKR